MSTIVECDLVLVEDNTVVSQICFNIEVNYIDIHGGDILRYGNISLLIMGRIHGKDYNKITYATQKKVFTDDVQFYKCLDTIKCEHVISNFYASNRLPKRFYILYRLFKRLIGRENDVIGLTVIEGDIKKQLMAFNKLFGVVFYETDSVDLVDYMYDLDQAVDIELEISDDFEEYDSAFRECLSLYL
jgi:hypothetical protein